MESVETPWASEGFFPRGTIVDFFRGTPKDFPGGTKTGKISFFPLETKKTTFLAKNVIGKSQVSKSRGDEALPCLLFPTPLETLVLK